MVGSRDTQLQRDRCTRERERERRRRQRAREGDFGGRKYRAKCVPQVCYTGGVQVWMTFPTRRVFAPAVRRAPSLSLVAHATACLPLPPTQWSSSAETTDVPRRVAATPTRSAATTALAASRRYTTRALTEHEPPSKRTACGRWIARSIALCCVVVVVDYEASTLALSPPTPLLYRSIVVLARLVFDLGSQERERGREIDTTQ